MRLVRENAAHFRLDPKRIGMTSFSAGAITTFGVLQRADDAARPNIAAPIYGFAFETDPPAETSPLFMAVAQDDPVMATASADVQKAWEAGGRSSQLHVFASGGHGFGMGRPGTESTEISGVFEALLRKQGFVE